MMRKLKGTKPLQGSEPVERKHIPINVTYDGHVLDMNDRQKSDYLTMAYTTTQVLKRPLTRDELHMILVIALNHNAT